MHNDVEINYGVDFERALERLHHAAGKVFRQYREAKHGNADVAQIARLRRGFGLCWPSRSDACPKKNARARRAFFSDRDFNIEEVNLTPIGGLADHR